MKSLNCVLLIAAMFALLPVSAKDLNITDKALNKCRSDLKVCQHLISRITDDIRLREWDVEKNKFPLDALTKIRNNNYDFAACQYEYHACKNGQTANLDEFRKKLSTTPESEWELSTPAEEGIDPETIKQVVQFAESIEGIRSLLIAKNGKLISESYFQFKDDPRPQLIASVTKSVVSLLIGIAIDKGHIPSENVSIKPYFKNYFSSANQPDKEKIRIVDLLSMKSGLDYRDKTHMQNTDYEKAFYWMADYWYADNANDYALKFDMAYKPGEQYQYSSPAIDLFNGHFKPIDRYDGRRICGRKFIWSTWYKELYMGARFK